MGFACIVGSLIGVFYGVVATLAVRRFAHLPYDPAPNDPVRGAPSVSILKPMRGHDPGLDENLRSFCVQDYPGPVQLVLGVQDPNDPAIQVVRRIMAAHPELDIVLTVGAPGHGGNRKIANLMNMAPRATGEILVISDSDVRVAPDHLRRVVGALQSPRVGLVTCLYRSRSIGNIWSKLAAMDVDFRFTPGVAVAIKYGINNPCLGPTMALRRSLLMQIGGLARLSDLLADDYELGRAVREAGLELAFASGLIEHACAERSVWEMLAHELRWAHTVRHIVPASYLGSVITHAFALALIGAVLTGASGWSLSVLFLVTLLRVCQVALVGGYTGADRGGIALTPLRDLLSFGVFVAAFFGDRVEWRGARLRLKRSDGVTVCSRSPS
jgi:ceramide glucosyltransferase